MQFYICPVPKLHQIMMDPSTLFYTPNGTPCYYRVLLNNDKITITDTVSRSVTVNISDVESLLGTVIPEDKECVYLMANQSYVPFDVNEFFTLSSFLEEIVIYTEEKQLMERAMLSILAQGAEA